MIEGMDNSESDPIEPPARPLPKRKVRGRQPIVGEVVAQEIVGVEQCCHCGTALPPSKGTGRPRVYCSARCRKAAYDDRRAQKPDAAHVVVADLVIRQTVQTVSYVEHKRIECVRAVLSDPQAIYQALRGLSRQVGSRALTPDQDAFANLARSADYLNQAFIRAARRSPPPAD